jgi:hypothetical protein
MTQVITLATAKGANLVLIRDEREREEIPELPPLNVEELAQAIELEPLKRIAKDLRSSATTLTKREARYLVDIYYQTQGFRMRANSQVRAASASGEPNDFVSWVLSTFALTEKMIREALGDYTLAHPLGQWARTIPGVGPVICAGFLAILDEAPPPTVGHWWRFAGQDPSLEWLGTERANKLVAEVMGTERTVTAEHIATIAERTNRSMESIRRLSRPFTKDRAEDEVRVALNEIVSNLASGEMKAAFTKAAEFDIDLGDVEGLIWNEADLDDERMPELVSGIADATLAIRSVLYAKAIEGHESPRAALIAGLSRRPWSAPLKVLCWKAGESCVKVMNNDADVYGHLYVQRKAYETAQNEQGLYADQAAIWIKRVGKETQAYKHYQKGRLSPGHIHGRAKRWTVKLFLSHWHTVAYFLRYGQLPTRPYPIGILGHAHLIAPPFVDMVPGLAEAMEAWAPYMAKDGHQLYQRNA